MTSKLSPSISSSNARSQRAFHREDGGSQVNRLNKLCSQYGAQQVQWNASTRINERRQLWMFIVLPAASRGMSITCGMRLYSKQVYLLKKRKRGKNCLARKGCPTVTEPSLALSDGNSGKALSMWCVARAVRLVHSRTRIER